MDKATIIRLAIECGIGDKDLSSRDQVVTDYGDATSEICIFAAAVAASVAAAVKEEDARAWQKATKEIIDRTVAPDMYANAMDMLHAAIRASIKEVK